MGRKRSRDYVDYDDNKSNQFGVGATLSLLRGSPEKDANSTSTNSPASEKPSADQGWQQVPPGGKKKRRKDAPKGTSNYPLITHSPNARLQTHVRISDFQNLALYILSDGPAPQWVSVRHHNAIKKVVILTIPGFDPGMFTGTTSLVDTELDTDSSEAVDIANSGEDKADNHLSTLNPSVKSSSPKDAKADAPQTSTKKIHLSPDDYYPKKLDMSRLPKVLTPFADMFHYIWPIKAPGDDKFSKIHSPLQAMLLSPLPKSREEKKAKGPLPAKTNNWTNTPTPVTKFLASAEELEENDYVLHPAMYATESEKEAVMSRRRAAKQAPEDGWIDTTVDMSAPDKSTEISGEDFTASRKVIAIDCEMCKTEGDQFELTRISVLDWDGKVILDELVKPDTPIKDYLTPYSGITAGMLAPVTTRLADIQIRLQEILTPTTVVVGHSLEGDFKALKMTHTFIVDTAFIYPHPRGPPLKSSLKWLAQKYLQREIQKSHGSTGHDSVEDAKAVLDLVKQKCERGPQWGTSESSSESIYVRLKRSLKPTLFRKNPDAEEFRTGAIVDWGVPSRGYGASADVIVGCESDAEVVEGIKNVLKSDSEAASLRDVDFVWARFREVEALRGWWGASKTIDNDELRRRALAKYSVSEEEVQVGGASTAALSKAVSHTVSHVAEIYEALPPCTAFLVYSGHNDPRETFRLQALQHRFRQEYRVKKWDQLSVKWTDVEDQQLRKASKRAREGIGFVVVK